MEHVISSSHTMDNKIMVYNKNRFYPKLPEKTIRNLIDIFCVESLAKTRCFSIGARPVVLTKKAEQWLGFSNNNYTISDIKSRMKEKDVLIVKNDPENPEKYTVIKKKFVDLGSNQFDYPYIYSYVKVKDDDGTIWKEKINLKRVFMPISEAIKSFTLNPNAQTI